MKKKIMLIVIASFMIMGAVSAASLWGTYKGSRIIRITVDHEPITVTDVPAINYNGRTMVPIYLLKEAGIFYSWDEKSQTVNLVSHNGKETILGNQTKEEIKYTDFKISDISKELKQVNVEFVEYASDGRGFNSITFYYNNTFDTLFDESNRLNTIYAAGLKTDATSLKVVDKSDSSMTVTKTSLVDFYDGKITGEQFIGGAKLSGNYFTSNKTNLNNGGNVIPKSSSYLDLYSNDGKTYLGKLTSDKYDSDSIFNEYGTYGSKYQSKSVWNNYGDYGSDYSDKSAYNKYATKPPIIVLEGKIIGYLTVNTTTANAISPIGLLQWLQLNGY